MGDSMPKTFIELADSDRRVAKLVLSLAFSDNDSTLRIAGFHIQQCLEKSLKALLESLGFDYRGFDNDVETYYRVADALCPELFSADSQVYIEQNSKIIDSLAISQSDPSTYLYTRHILYGHLVAVERIHNECSFGVMRCDNRI